VVERKISGLFTEEEVEAVRNYRAAGLDRSVDEPQWFDEELLVVRLKPPMNAVLPILDDPEDEDCSLQVMRGLPFPVVARF
jgi:hypothetical protein